MRQLLLLLLSVCCFLTASADSNPKGYKKAIKKHRKEYKAAFLKDHGPLEKQDLKYLDFYEADATYRIKAAFERTPDSKPFEMLTSSGVKKQYVQYGVLSFTLDGQDLFLNVYQSLKLRKMPQYRDYLFLPFKDATNDKETYGGGRYIDLKMGAIKEGKVSIDFNKAYNPYCAFKGGYACPIPPKANHLDVQILAGEKKFLKKKGGM